jgi:uncharacterized phage-associated protein
MVYLSADALADYLILAAAEEQRSDEPMTNLRLQKLLYYGQGWHLALTGKPLIREEVQAWRHGPVVRSVYQKFKPYGFRRLPLPESSPPQIDPETRVVLDAVWEAYGHLSARRLRELTHRETPWKAARDGYADDENCESEITRETMRSYFSARLSEDRERRLARQRAAYSKVPTTAEEQTIADASLELLAASS